jgi:NEDD8-activating enzyme E1 regulatory subunit
MANMSGHDKAHTPYICLLLHYLEQWRKDHQDKVPDTYKEKQEFRDSYVRKGSPDEENFDEACAAVLKSLNPPTPSSAVRDILNAPEALELTAASPPFWFIASAIRQFYTKHGELPLPGAVPDMKAQSADYIKLQNIYKTKAREDCAEVIDTVRELEQSTGRSPKLAINEKEIENFCKGAAHIHLVRGRVLQIVEPGIPVSFGERAKAMVFELNNPESLIGEYIAFLAWDDFVVTHATKAKELGGEGLRVPGSSEAEFEADKEKMVGIAHKIVDALIAEAGEHIEDPEYTDIKDNIEKMCVELVRAGGGELHNVASLTGGLIAQEVIKVITKQYVPVDNTCLFDGIASRSYVLRV